MIHADAASPVAAEASSSSEVGMTGLSILLLLLAPPQEPKKADEGADRAKRAAVVDKIMIAPPQPGVVRVPNAEAIEQLAVRRAALQAQRRITLELKAVVADEEKDENGDPVFRAQAMGVRNIADLALSKDNFDRWVFQDELSEEARKRNLDHLLRLKIRPIEEDQGLGDEALRKLWLAGYGDIKRFFDKVEMARADFEAARQDYTAGRLALTRLAPLADEYKASPFGPDSLFAKTLSKLRSDKKSTTPEEK
jgi:hypothetical protein